MKVIQVDTRGHYDGAFNYLISVSAALAELRINNKTYINKNLLKDVPAEYRNIFDDVEAIDLGGDVNICILHGVIDVKALDVIKLSGAKIILIQHNMIGSDLPWWIMDDGVSRLVPVTEKVRDSLIDAGVSPSRINSPSYFHDRIYRKEVRAKNQKVIAWNKKKLRDIVFWLSGYQRFGCHVNRRLFELKDDDVIVLGIFSRLARLKRFPELLSLIAPFFPANIRLDLYGSGSYREVSCICKVFREAGFNNYRFMGWSDDVAQVFNSIDYLLLGRPDVEAMGINLIEAINHNVGVIAIEERPFTEIVPNQPGVIYYLDPATDGGGDFKEKIMQIEKPVLGNNLHLYDFFSWGQFVERIRAILQGV